MTQQNPKLAIAVAALASLLASQAAQATLTVSSSTTGGPLPGSNKVTFDTLPAAGGNAGAGITVTFAPDGGVATGTSGTAAAPYFNAPANDAEFSGTFVPPGGIADPTQYLTTGVGSVTLTFASPQTYMGLLWGSLDDYNKLEFFSGGSSVGTVVPGVNVPDEDGNQGLGGTRYVNILSDQPFDKVVATSRLYAFEFDNVAIVPEPSTYFAAALLGLPFVASVVRRRMAKIA